ncbi:MAG: MBOAT family O-acyltransferase [Bacteroidota bacterium]|nr:MBOAT family O-acyltransferase [Bacteroidota bacterium]
MDFERLYFFFVKLLQFSDTSPFLFTSEVFWIFFTIVLGGFAFVYKRIPLRNLYLFVISLFFYYRTSGPFLDLLLISCLTNYLCGLAIGKSLSPLKKKLWLTLSLITNLGILSYFKYAYFIINLLNQTLNTKYVAVNWLVIWQNEIFGTHNPVEKIILPIGISFFTFQAISYVVDVYRGDVKALKNPLDFGFYLTFFPQLVAGPIVRAAGFIPQIYQKYQVRKEEFGHALFLIIGGLIKKIIISDYLSINFVDRVFETPLSYSGIEVLMAIYGYALQIYCDFSGYTDIAIGLGLLMGFRLPINFNSPYRSANISEFWKRWHISLSLWLKDYLYIPLGGNRKGKIRTYLNLMITMLLGGLWHGANIRFIIWGGIHGMALCLHRLWKSIFPNLKSTKVTRTFSIILTFHFVAFAWICFRADDMVTIQEMLYQLTHSFFPKNPELLLPTYSIILVLIISGYFLHGFPAQIKEYGRGWFIQLPFIIKISFGILTGILLYYAMSAGLQPFIYFRF